MNSKEYRYTGDCKPLRTNDELLNFHRLPIVWSGIVEPITTRACVRYLGLDYENFVPSTEIEEINRPKVLVCHDLAGNYRGDRFINGSTKWDDYRFYHWSGIDFFCYFSHEYVTIPTLSWINAAHKHGVKVLGTIIFENVAGRIILEEILQSEDTLKSVVDALVLIAKRCKFEGWLLNVECDLKSTKIPLLRDFVEYLTLQMHHNVHQGVVIWYDSIIESGQLLWQNELNHKNKLFFDACDGILINYAWNEQSLIRTEEIVNGMPESMSKIYFGIDVFGRGQRAKFETAVTLKRIKKHSFSVGIFAPGWTFETCGEFGINIHTTHGTDICNNTFIDRNNRFWAMLWQFFATTGPNKLPFYSSFCLGSGRRRYRDGMLVQPSVSWINLAKQSLQPSVPVGTIQRSFDEAYNGGSCIKVLRTEKPKRLFVVDFKCSNDIIISYAHKATVQDEDLCVLLGIVDDLSGRTCLLECGNGNAEANSTYIICKPIEDINLRNVLICIGERNEKSMPTTSINGWEIRYFYLCFDDTLTARITDVGVHVRTGDGTYLGAIHIHEGMKSANTLDCSINNVSLISKQDFK